MKQWNRNLKLLVALVLISTPACASIVSKSDYPVTVSSNPPEANIVIRNDEGVEVYRGKTPATITLDASAGYFSRAKYQVELSKDGYEKQIITVKGKMDGWYVGNLLFGGLIGFLIVDPATGAMWKLPNTQIATLAEQELPKPKGTPEQAAEAGSGPVSFRVMSIDEVPARYRDRLIPVAPGAGS